MADGQQVDIPVLHDRTVGTRKESGLGMESPVQGGTSMVGKIRHAMGDVMGVNFSNEAREPCVKKKPLSFIVPVP